MDSSGKEQEMANSICENCWMAVGDMAKHLWEEHGVLPSQEAQERIARQRADFERTLAGMDEELNGKHVEGISERQQLAWGGKTK